MLAKMYPQYKTYPVADSMQDDEDFHARAHATANTLCACVIHHVFSVVQQRRDRSLEGGTESQKAEWFVSRRVPSPPSPCSSPGCAGRTTPSVCRLGRGCRGAVGGPETVRSTNWWRAGQSIKFKRQSHKKSVQCMT